MLKKIAIGLIALCIVGAVALFALFPPMRASHPALQGNLPDLVPMRAYFADAQAQWRFRLSPDGTHMAWLEAKRLKPALWVRPLDGDTTDIFHTPDEVRWYQWSADSRYLLYQADRDGWENDVVVSIDVKNSNAAPRAYDFGKDVKTFIHSVPAEGGADILIAHNGRDPQTFDLYRLNLDSGETTPLHEVSELGVSWQSNRKGEIYARSVYRSPEDWRTELRMDDGSWREIARGGLEDAFYVISEPDEDGQILAVSSLDRDTSALLRMDVETGQTTTIHANDTVDLAWAETDPLTGKLLSAVTYPDRQARAYFDADYADLMARVPGGDTVARHWVSATADVDKLIVETESPTEGWNTYLVDQNADTVETISTAGIAVYSDALSTMEPVQITARDGLVLHATLTKPKGVSTAAPMVILIHGGPVTRSSWGWSDLHSWLANRGYVVLDVNYRGSGGFGRAFREAAVGEVSRKMHLDIVDARAWAVDQGLADPEKVAVLGGSFGGLKVLTALTESPDLFAAGIDINGISDISTMLQEVPAYWRGWPHWYKKYIGDPNDPDDLAEIKRRSPLYNAEKMTAPVLILQGANDVRVIQDQADRMVAALEEAGKDVEYVLMKGAGHQFSNWGWKARILAHRRMERFLAEHLGGRADGFDYAVLGALILP